VTLLPANPTVVEILETVEPEDRVVGLLAITDRILEVRMEATGEV
jgi:hypothetical protein